MKQLDDIKEFHTKFGVNYDGEIRPIRHKEIKFRVGCLLEEVSELNGALQALNFSFQNHEEKAADVLDALVDIDYFLKGTIEQLGFSGIYEQAWNIVHKANMKKIRANENNPSKRDQELDIVKPKNWIGPEQKLIELIKNA